MAFDDIEDSFNSRARDSFNTSTTNSANLNVGLENVGNTDNSVNDSGNAWLGIDDSFTHDSHDVDVDTDVDVDDSFNTVTDTSTFDRSDHSINGSYNSRTDASIDDSYNTFVVSKTDDHSIEVGTRTYNTGFGDLNVGAGAGAAAGAGGDLWLDNRATIVDQSVNQNIDAFGVGQFGESSAVVASGDGAIAAGDDVDIDQELDQSTTIRALGGDVNIGNDTTIDSVVGSYNTAEDTSVHTDTSQDWDIHHSFNDYSDTYTATNSFNDEISLSNDTDWDIDANVIWDSGLSAIVHDVDVDLPPA